MRSTLLHMLHAELSPSHDPFLFDCLLSIRSHHLFALRKKARILVEKGAVLVGGLDETALLPEGTIYVEFMDVNGCYTPLVGPVLVAKHPVMHPGDIRMLLAVDIEALHGHRNCILFSRNGIRPEADKMAGSDLDGDEFAITWDERLFIGEWNRCVKERNGAIHSRAGHCLHGLSTEADAKVLSSSNAMAMEYQIADTSQNTDSGAFDFSNLEFNDLENKVLASLTGQPNQNTSSSLSSKSDDELSFDLLKHFLNHIKLASVGRICMLWLDYAVVNGADCTECLALARLHSIAVDFPKSGIPSVIPRELVLTSGTPRAHWREMKGAPSFRCSSVLGQLYDEVIERSRSRFDKKAALAGRRIDKYGTIVCNVVNYRHSQEQETAYNCRITRILSRSLGRGFSSPKEESQLFANEQRSQYENEYLQTMNKYRIRSEGEAATGCIRKYHKLQKRRQANFAEEVRRIIRGLRRKHRIRFFRKVLELVKREQEEARMCAVELASSIDNFAVFPASSNVAILEKPNQDALRDVSDVDGDDDEDNSYVFEEEEEDSVYDPEDYDSDEEPVDEAEIQWVEKVATARGSIVPVDDAILAQYPIGSIRKWAAQLGAAYYESTYAPDLRWQEASALLFSFPWIVAGDVICCMMVEFKGS